MKTREEIEEQFKDVTAPAGMSDLYRMVVEILLDIRELLTEEKMMRMEEKIRKAREAAEKERAREKRR